MGADRHRLASRLRRLGNHPNADALNELATRIDASRQRRARRQRDLPAIDYPESLPVSARRADIRAAIAAHQVVLVCGETGSGKTTQLPKILLEMGRGIDGLIGHTQPRRLAARAVATRIAEELKSELGTKVGYKVRFTDQTSPDSYIKVMTDGILLAEIQRDRWLGQYDTLIIDEAHERSLNIDFLLGYLKRLLRKRRDLKLVITSATIDAQRIAAHFDDAPIVEVSGRSFPVELRYRPPRSADPDGDDLTLPEAIDAAIDELQAEGRGDVLVFLPGEREIHEISHALRHRRDRFDVLPLYARLPAREQHRIFHPGGRTRIVLATNVAETSLTVPGIRYVIDSGLARISRYSWRAKIQRLPVEKISQASANQRAGRCGRTAPGICIRLYDEEDFEHRPRFTDPEILRTNLAAVILQMANLKLGEVAGFPFIDPPDPRLIRDGYRLLTELQAVDANNRLTPIGRQLARLPIDPRLGRMLLAAERLGCIDEVLIVTTALAAQDPRERPRDRQQAADERHARFNEPGSDFLTLLKLWRHLESQFEALSRSAMQKYCRQHFISFRRWREWRDLHRQIKLALQDLGIRSGGHQAAEPEAIHQALLHGLLDHVGSKEEKQRYLGCRNRKFLIFPGSGLWKKPPRWIMAAEITETSKVYARTNAAIQPQWIERIGAHLLRHQVSEPHWQKRAARVGAFEKLTLYGLVINPKRRIDYGKVDPAGAREIFIRHALVLGEYQTRLTVIRDNRALIDELEALEARSRRRDILVDEQTLYDFYDRLIPADVYSGPLFERWYKRLDDPEILRLTKEKLTRPDTAPVDADAFPEQWRQQGLTLPLEYHFDPASEHDGVTLKIPLPLLPQIDARRCQWLVPGLLEEKVLALIRGLPKSLRRHFVPAPDFARAACEAMTPYDGDLQEALTTTLKRMTGVEIDPAAWSERLPRHLQMRFVILDRNGRPLRSGRDLDTLRGELKGRVKQEKPPRQQHQFEKTGLHDWDFGPLPPVVEQQAAGYTLRRYPALTREGDSIALRLFDTEAEARAAMPAGLRGLLRQRLKQEIRYLDKNLPEIARLCLQFATIGSCQALKDDLYEAAIQYSFLDDLARFPANADDFDALFDGRRGQFVETANEIATTLGKILPRHLAITKRIKGNLPLSLIEACGEIRQQLDAMIHPGFITATPRQWFHEIPRYLEAIQIRLEKLPRQPDKDRLLRVEIAPLIEHLEHITPQQIANDPRLSEYRWLLEELRVSLFAQTLGTRRKVSPQRLDRLWKEIARQRAAGQPPP